MKTIKCVGYEGHKCGKVVPVTNGSQKRCARCAKKNRLMYNSAYNNSIKGHRSQIKYDRSPKGHRKSRRRAWKKYGLIGLTYEKWLQDEKKGCILRALGNCVGKLGADHDHKTGKYRGPLCMLHNHGLGILGDSVKKLRQAIKILEGAWRLI